MTELYVSAALMTGLTLVFGGVLAFASRYWAVETDPRLPEVESLLGGSNCGACGKPGCHAFAEALLKKTVTPGQCTVIGREQVEQLAELTGQSAAMQDRRVARVHCAGGRSAVPRSATYTGRASCAAAFRDQRAGRACAYGCVGFGDCERSCEFDAITMNEEGLPVIDPERCTACGDCVTACPADLISLVPEAQEVIVQCSSPLVGEAARASCAVACDACGRCAIDAPAGAIVIEQGLPRLVHPEQLGEAVTFRCPSGALSAVGTRQFQYDVPLSALRRHLG